MEKVSATTPFEDAKEALRQDFAWRRLFAEDEGVIGNNPLSTRREGRFHLPANLLRLFLAFALPPLYLSIYSDTSSLFVNFLLPEWKTEKAYAPKAFLHDPKRIDGLNNLYHPGQARPRWLIKVKYAAERNHPGSRQIRLIAWSEDEKALETNMYTALSYSYQNAKELFHEAYPRIPLNAIPPEPHSTTQPNSIIDDPLLTAWRQPSTDSEERRRWKDIAVRQRVARVFLDRYLDSNHKPGQIEYIWLDEFCLYDGSDPSLKDRDEELGRMADIFSQAAAVCVYCPRNRCNHAGQECDWGNRLWTLSEILHTNKVITMTRQRRSDGHPWEYELVEREGRNFRADMQREAEIKGAWHLAAIMRHANNGGSMTWQHSIHALVLEAIRRNMETNATSDQPNKFLAKALNGLLPRRANPKDLTGKDGWADLAWLLEINQGFYNAATLAAVCSLGETKVQGHGWLGAPIAPSAGNERLHPLITAFPIKEGLLLMDPVVIGLREKLERDPGGMSFNRKLRFLNAAVIFLPVITIIWVIIPYFFVDSSPSLTRWTIFWIWLGFALTAMLKLIGGTLYVQKGGIILLREKKLQGKSPEEYLGSRDNELAILEQWGDEQLAPRWTTGIQSESEEVTLVDLMSRVQSKFMVRNWEGKEPNALVPVAVHGCGVTCLVLHHHKDPSQPAIKLGIVSMPPYILVLGEKAGSIVVGAVPEEPVTPMQGKTTSNPYSMATGQGYPYYQTNWPRYTPESATMGRYPYGSQAGFAQSLTAGAYPPTPNSERGQSPYGSQVALMPPSSAYSPANGSGYGFSGSRRV